MRYLADLFSAGDEDKVKDRLKRLWAIRINRRWKTVGDIIGAEGERRAEGHSLYA